ncbi:UvrD-helicase domain-containing protein [Haliscomenobacter hydrossis]|uniref:UvrD/REP helicase n=1 Tax=Haliscomenobacter hydrossis (strain ATCC 27775 / DSM 1100 / LMG 10767 / O) TaxID=760192 RepID=F4KXU5_HALH1|nr:UvrD-helicase domain-containing protein [Haliscomenobacter hydrossis]AEE52604.1 UvrD/REP helicase [Haliscomenobacter hydrossis DSM 1100]
MSKEKLIDWLRAQQPKIESILLNSAQEYYSKYSAKSYFEFDAKKTGQEMWSLSRGEDLCYDRPTIGFNYSLWYHPKRINTFLQYFTDLIYDSRKEKHIEIFDLGAGTGAVLWAVGLVVSGLEALKIPSPKIRVINIDTSAFMLIYSYHYLWKNFIKEFPQAEGVSNQTDFRLNSWSNLDEALCTNVWLCASYLFDHSENSEAIAEEFKELISQYKPNKILLLSSAKKCTYVNTVADSIQTLGYNGFGTILKNQIFLGALKHLYRFRSNISEQHKLNLSGVPKWNIDSLCGRVLMNHNPMLSLNFAEVKLFIQPEPNRTKIKLTSDQEDAAKIISAPTLVIGPAGCGKSVVLTQKIKNILDSTKINNEYDPDLKILVTTFNKALVRYLGDWIEQILDSNKFTRRFGRNYYGQEQDYSFFTFTNPRRTNIYVMHFDILPTKIGRVNRQDVTIGGADIDGFHLEQMQNAIESYVTQNNIDEKRFHKILDAEFLLDEYHRVVYGNLCNCYLKRKPTDIEYATIPRDGRGNNPKVDIRSGRRKIAWGIINIYLSALKMQNLESFITRRHKWVKKLIENGFQNQFNYILVDEFQDCTKADYEIFYRLLSNHNNLTLAGDIAQSINIGHSLYIPRSDDPTMKNIKKKPLEGSFRLPFRVSECIKPLSVNINRRFGAREGFQPIDIIPYKGAPPGSRPLFIYAKDTETAAIKIKEVFFAYYKALKLSEVTIFERDNELCSALYLNQTPAKTEIILRTKGLEKSCVVWSTRIDVDTQTEKEEFIYTILTRTVSLLIIVVFPNIQQDYVNIIKLFEPKRLICWDEESEVKYTELGQSTYAITYLDDQDDAEEIEADKDDDEKNIDELIS